MELCIEIKWKSEGKINFGKLISVYEGATLGLNVPKEVYEKYKDDWKMILNDVLNAFYGNPIDMTTIMQMNIFIENILYSEKYKNFMEKIKFDEYIYEMRANNEKIK